MGQCVTLNVANVTPDILPPNSSGANTNVNVGGEEEEEEEDEECLPCCLKSMGLACLL